MGSNHIKRFIFLLLTYLCFNEELPIFYAQLDAVIKAIHTIKTG